MLAATIDRRLARADGRAHGAEVHGPGRTLLGAPTVNIAWPPVMESRFEDDGQRPPAARLPPSRTTCGRGAG